MANDVTAVRDADHGHLLRVLGVAFGVAVVVGGTIGQGILRTPGIVAENTPMPLLIIGLWGLGALIALVVNAALFVAFVTEDPWTSLQAFTALGVLTVLAWLATRGTRAARREQV